MIWFKQFTKLFSHVLSFFKKCCFHFHHYMTYNVKLQNLAMSEIQRKKPTCNKNCCYYPVIEPSRNGNLLQYSCLENPMDRGAWRATVHRVTRVGPDLVTKPPPLDIYLEILQTRRSALRVFAQPLDIPTTQTEEMLTFLPCFLRSILIMKKTTRMQLKYFLIPPSPEHSCSIVWCVPSLLCFIFLLHKNVSIPNR